MHTLTSIPTESGTIETLSIDRADIFEYATAALEPSYAVACGDESSPELDDLVDFLERTCAEAQSRCRLPKSREHEWSPKFAWTVPAMECVEPSDWLSQVAAGHFLGSDFAEALDDLGLTFLAARALVS